MEKIYITPKIKVREIDIENSLLENSLNGVNPSSGLPDAPTNGGTATGGSAGSAGSKFNSWAAWGSEEED